ncbi:MAG: FtsX-like permease family protein [Desulfobulbaceae bacterium]|nr:MAG: FtsX-like permease family protein [Desulfobulbaceae bacterium]
MSLIEKHRNIIDYTLSSLGRRKGKTFAVCLVYSFIIFLLASVVFFTQAIKREADLLLREAPEMTVQRLEAGRQTTVPAAYADGIGRIRGVQSVQKRLWGYYFDSLTGANYTVMVNASLNGREGQAIVGSGVLLRGAAEGESRKIQAGDSLPVKTYRGEALMLKVAGILPFASELETADLIQVSERDYRDIFNAEAGRYTDLALQVRNRKELATIATKIVRQYPDTRPILREDILRTYDAIFDWRGGLSIMTMAGALFAFIILAWDKATGLSAEEKKEIGILKAIGWETGDILQVKFWEGVSVSLTSFSIGIFAAYLHVFVGSSLLFEPVLKGWSVLYPDFRLTPHIDAYQLVSLLFITVLPYTVATIIPSWRSATIDPDSVMRA